MRNQADGIKKNYHILQEKLDQLNVFSGYASLLRQLSEYDIWSKDLKNASIFLTDCQTTVNASCNATEFDDLLTKANVCWNEVNCSNVPDECRLKTERDTIAERKNSCISLEVSGSFGDCMNFIKNDLYSIIQNDLPPRDTPIECETVRMEGGEAIKEKSSYDPNTKELTIYVPLHGTRPSIIFLISETKTAIIYDQECLVADTSQDYLDVLNGAENTGDGCKDIKELAESDLSNHYFYNIDQGILSEDDIAKLPLSIQDACALKIIRGTVTVPVDEPTFNNTNPNPVLPGSCNPPQGCSKSKTICSKSKLDYCSSSGGYLFGVSLHIQGLNLVCVECCEDGSSKDLCACSDIQTDNKEDSKFFECYGNCTIGEYQCQELDKCISFDQPCGNCTGDDCCYGDGKKCGEECIYKYNGDYEKYDCNGVCVKNDQKCDFPCPFNSFQCGDNSEAKCIPETDFDLFRTCRESGKCLTNMEPCGDDCRPDYIKCGDDCRKKTEYRDCNGECVPRHEQCDGSCPVGRQACGQKFCLSTDSSEAYSTAHYRECNGAMYTHDRTLRQDMCHGI